MRFFHCRRCHWKDGNPDRCFSSSFRCNRYDSGNTGATADAVEGEAGHGCHNDCKHRGLCFSNHWSAISRMRHRCMFHLPYWLLLSMLLNGSCFLAFPLQDIIDLNCVGCKASKRVLHSYSLNVLWALGHESCIKSFGMA